MKTEKTVDVIIPVYRPSETFGRLLAMLGRQSVKPGKIIIMNTERSLWEEAGADRMMKASGAAGICEIHHIGKDEFDHGATRNEGVKYSKADLFICMTQDAIPVDECLIEELTACISDRVPAAYARQIPADNCAPAERITREFNYPAEGRIKTEADIQELGIKTFFLSNVCACYDRKTFDHQGGFTDRTVFNEDMIYAAGLIRNGLGICYCAKAAVIHSHNYTAGQQLHRNFDNGVSQADHPEIFAGIRSESEGIRLVKTTASELMKQGLWFRIPGMVMTSGFKYLGFRLGRSYRKLPQRLVKTLSMNKNYWR